MAISVARTRSFPCRCTRVSCAGADSTRRSSWRARLCGSCAGRPGHGTARLPALERTLLLRTRDTRELGHLGPIARLQEIAGAFAVADPVRLRGRRVLLIDDVFTTGATLNECAGALRGSGAREVRVVALARAV